MKKGDFQSFTSPEANARGHPCTAQQEKLGFYVEQKSYFGNVNSSRIQRQAVSWATTGRSLWQSCWEKTHKNRWLCSCCFPKLDPSISLSDIHNAVSASTPLIQANLSLDPKQASSPVILPLNFQPCSYCIYPWWNSVSDYQAQETPLFGKHLSCLVPSISESIFLCALKQVACAAAVKFMSTWFFTHAYHSLLFPNFQTCFLLFPVCMSSLEFGVWSRNSVLCIHVLHQETQDSA